MEQKLTNNLTATNVSESVISEYENNEGTFWVFATIYLLLALVTAKGNGLVIYAAFSRRNIGLLPHFDNVIKSLAVNDLLLGLFGFPCRITIWYYYVHYGLGTYNYSNIC